MYLAPEQSVVFLIFGPHFVVRRRFCADIQTSSQPKVMTQFLYNLQSDRELRSIDS